MNTTIEQLRKSGYKVRVMHFRYFNKYPTPLMVKDLNTKELNPKGGLTRVEVRSPSGVEVFGEAICSTEDPFNRRMGNKIAVGRALATLEKINAFTKTVDSI